MSYMANQDQVAPPEEKFMEYCKWKREESARSYASHYIGSSNNKAQAIGIHLCGCTGYKGTNKTHAFAQQPYILQC